MATSLATAPALGASGDELRLARIASEAGLLFGFALDPRQLASDPAYAAFVARQASIVVPENVLKWQAVHPAENWFAFTDADAVASFARKNGIRQADGQRVYRDVQRLAPGRMLEPALVRNHDRSPKRDRGLAAGLQ